MPQILKIGDRVLATYDETAVGAEVIIASPNGRSLVIKWEDGMLGGHCGMMPIYMDDAGKYFSLVEGREVTLIKVVDEDEADKADFIVCVRAGTPTQFDDNVSGVCVVCSRGIVFRPYLRFRAPKKICIECALELKGGGGNA